MSVVHRLNPTSPDSTGAAWLEIVREKVKDLRFGVVQIVVHDSHVVQIERTEKTRLDQPRKPEGKGGDALRSHD